MKILLIILSLFLASCQKNHKPLSKLSLINIYEVNTLGEFEPSGLTSWDGTLYTVSDKHDKIYKVEFGRKSVKLIPYITILNPEGGKLDFEGITHDENNFYLISEIQFRILKVSKDGKQQQWLNNKAEMKQIGESNGLFEIQNANVEGICYLGNRQLLLSAERQPRGFMTVDNYEEEPLVFHAYRANDSIFPRIKERPTDFTGLSCENGVFALERNAYLIAQLVEKHGKLIEKRGWSYQHIIEQNEFLYTDMKYGRAEGLVVDGDTIYIILDNNRNYHLADNTNNNSLLLVLSKK